MKVRIQRQGWVYYLRRWSLLGYFDKTIVLFISLCILCSHCQRPFSSYTNKYNPINIQPLEPMIPTILSSSTLLSYQKNLPTLPPNILTPKPFCCGMKDHKIYINNGSYESIIIASDVKFSAFVQYNDDLVAVSGIAVSERINEVSGQSSIKELIKHHNRNSETKAYFIHSKSQIFDIRNNGYMNILSQESKQHKNPKQTQQPKSQPAINTLQKLKQPTQPDNQQRQKSYHQVTLDLYTICKSLVLSTATIDLKISVTLLLTQYQENKENFNLVNGTSILPNQQKYLQQKLLLQIPTVVYCISETTIHQANYFIEKVFYLVVVAVFGFVISFKPFGKVDFWVRIVVIVGYLFVAFNYADKDWYLALVLTYGGIIGLMFVGNSFFNRQRYGRNIISQGGDSKYLLTKSFVIVSLASSFPLAIKSHIKQPSYQIKPILILFINLVMLINNIIFISSLIKLSRFRHCMYYFMIFVILQHMLPNLYPQLTQSLIFNIVSPQIFYQPYRCESYFFMIFIIPLCQFFFQSYSNERLLKFVVLILPIIFRPLIQISYSFTFMMVWLGWMLNQGVRDRNLVNIVKYRR